MQKNKTIVYFFIGSVLVILFRYFFFSDPTLRSPYEKIDALIKSTYDASWQVVQKPDTNASFRLVGGYFCPASNTKKKYSFKLSDETEINIESEQKSDISVMFISDKIGRTNIVILRRNNE